MTASPPPIRLTILTGFLGSGKTTLLNRLLAETDVTDTAVIVNEFGEAGIDPLLVETANADGIVELADGCVCCSVRGELVTTLGDLATRARLAGRGPLRRVIVETSGLSDPGPIIVSLMTDPVLLERFVLDGVVAVVDRLGGADTLASRNEAQRQVAIADRIVVTKSDLAPQMAGIADPLDMAISRLNPRALRMDAMTQAPLAPFLLNCGLVDAVTGRPDPSRWLGPAAGADGGGTGDEQLADGCAHDRRVGPGHGLEHGRPHGQHIHDHQPHHHAHGHVRSFSIVQSEPISLEAVTAFLDLLSATQGDRLLRMKAIVHCTQSPDRPIVLHGVRGYLHPPATLAAWPPGATRQTRLVLIGDGLSETYARDLFAAFTGGLRNDAPDRQVLEDNPLAIPGHSFS